MAKRKVNTKKRPTQHSCNCPYNHQISNIYTEAFEARVNDANDNEYTTVLLHNAEFNMMADAIESGEYDPRLVLADAVRVGFEAGRRKLELELLEKSVGY